MAVVPLFVQKTRRKQSWFRSLGESSPGVLGGLTSRSSVYCRFSWKSYDHKESFFHDPFERAGNS